MASSERSPSERSSARFEPKHLRRSIIAIPLREAMDEELKKTNDFLAEHPGVLENHNAAVFLDPAFPKGLAAARKVVAKRLKEAAEEAGAGAALGRIDPAAPGLPDYVSLAQLDGRVIRFLLAIDRGSKNPAIKSVWPTRFEVIIDLNLEFQPPDREVADAAGRRRDARKIAKEWIARYLEEAKTAARFPDPDEGIEEEKTNLSPQYVFARLEATVIEKLVEIDGREAAKLADEAAREAVATQGRTKKAGTGKSAKQRGTPTVVADEAKKLVSRFRTIHHIWPDFPLSSCMTQSIATVKVDAAHRAFTALGKGITWAVADSGINASHAHFRLHQNIDPASTFHADFTGAASPGSALVDKYGHGTHVAGIIAGEQSVEKKSDPKDMVAVWREHDETAEEVKEMSLEAICGMAPKCQLVSLKVLDRFGQGKASNVITAIAHVQEINHHGRELHIHGVNFSLGYPFEAKWFACGHSPLCVEVNRLVKSGVVVVVAAGNSGYGTLKTKEGESDACLDLTINDPGNAEGAITVGSTHRDMPHKYGVSYFSSKGPTGDGRCKPDLLAPGERIISCAAPDSRLLEDEAENRACTYFETSGTSMAAPHVSGAIAAFLSIRREFIGESEEVKKIFTSTATDLGRDRYFQGSGLVDLMRAIQSV